MAAGRVVNYAVTQNNTKKEQTMRNQVIVFQGDSITDWGRVRERTNPNDGLGNGYPLLVASRLLCERPKEQFQIYNRGISGNRIVDLYARWKIDALNLKPDVISILIGVNDTWHGFKSDNGVDVPRYEQFYRMLLAWTLESRPGVKLILGEPFLLVFGDVKRSWLPEIRQRQAVVRRLAAEFHAAFIPYQQIFDAACKRAPKQHWTDDGVHPTTAGHQLMADAWRKAFV